MEEQTILPHIVAIHGHMKQIVGREIIEVDWKSIQVQHHYRHTAQDNHYCCNAASAITNHLITPITDDYNRAYRRDCRRNNN